MSIRARSFFVVLEVRKVRRGSRILRWLLCLIVVLAFGSGRAFGGAGSSGGTIFTTSCTDFGTVALGSVVNGTVNGSTDTYTYQGQAFVGQSLHTTLINGSILIDLLSAVFPESDGALSWNLPDFGSSGTAAASTPSLDASNNFQTATFGVTSFTKVPGSGLGNPVGNSFSLTAANQADAVLNGLSGAGAISLAAGTAKTLSAVSTPASPPPTCSNPSPQPPNCTTLPACTFPTLSQGCCTLNFGSATTTSLINIGGNVFETVINTEILFGEVATTSWDVSGSADPGSPPPVCTKAVASVPTVWPPNHNFISEQIDGVTASAPGSVSINITGIRQDEPTLGGGSGDTCPDGQGVATGTAQVRAERDGTSDGRVYHINFTATDSVNSTCSGEVKVCVPHDQGPPATCVDNGPLFDSTLCGASSSSARRRHHKRRGA